MNMPRIYTDPSQSEATVAIISDMDMLEEKLTNMPNVATDEELELVSEYRAQFRAKSKVLDKERLTMTEGARATVSMVNDKYREIIERAERCVQLATNKMMPFMRERERKREEAEREAEEARRAEEAAAATALAAEQEANRVAAETQDAVALSKAEDVVKDARAGLDELRRTPVAKAAPKSVEGVLGSQTGMRKNWKYRIADFSKVPDRFLIPEADRLDKGQLNTIAKRDQENAIVPGIEFYYEDALTSRAGVQK